MNNEIREFSEKRVLMNVMNYVLIEFDKLFQNSKISREVFMQ